MREYSIYCDESCHLEYDHQPVMVLGSIWCPTSKRTEVNQRIREIKQKHKIGNNAEMKWSKASNNKFQAYYDLIDYFFDDDDLHFRALVVPDKAKLNHEAHDQTHNDWYYKMYFDLLKSIIANDAIFNIFLDIKDSIGGEKVRRLMAVLANDRYDFDRKIVRKVQLIRSEEVGIMQLVDILTGAVMAENRQSTVGRTKQAIIDRVKARSRYSLRKTTLLSEQKLNIFIWHGQE